MRRWLFLIVLWPAVCAAQVSPLMPPLVIRSAPAEWTIAPGLKVSINEHGDPLQPWPGDYVAISSFIDDRRGRDRIWSKVSSFSVYGAGPRVAVGHEIDANNLSLVEPDEPGGPRSVYGTWYSGASWSRYLGSAAVLITSADGSRWRRGILIDRADVGITLGGTFQNSLGIDLGQSSARFRAFSITPENPPHGTVELRAQYGPNGKMQLVVQWPSGAQVLAQEP